MSITATDPSAVPRPGHAPEGDVPLSLQQWGTPPRAVRRRSATVDCGWGRLLFGQTFDGPEQLAARLVEETIGEPTIAFFVPQPPVAVSTPPHALFPRPPPSFPP